MRIKIVLLFILINISLFALKDFKKDIASKMKEKDIFVTEVYLSANDFKFLDPKNIVLLFQSMPLSELSAELFEKSGVNIDPKLLNEDIKTVKFNNYQTKKSGNNIYDARWKVVDKRIKYFARLFILLSNSRTDFIIEINEKKFNKDESLAKFNINNYDWLNKYMSLDLKSDVTEEKNVKIEDIKTAPEICGISFSNMKKYSAGNFFSIEIPDSWIVDIKDKPEKDLNYLVLTANGSKPEFSNLISIYIVPVKNNKYNDVVAYSLITDFLKDSYKSFTPISKENSGAKDVKTFFGRSNKIGDLTPPGNLVGAYFYDEKNNVEIKILYHLIFMKKFTDDEWFSLLMNVSKILATLKLR